jgi:hypothetical protein
MYAQTVGGRVLPHGQYDEYMDELPAMFPIVKQSMEQLRGKWSCHLQYLLSSYLLSN